MQEEAKRSMAEFNFNVWKRWTEDTTLGELPTERMPKIEATYDMAWQQKGSGKHYKQLAVRT
jgi:hypothetical protein